MATVEMRPASPPLDSPMATPRPASVLAICCVSLFLVTMDVTIMNVALPAIGRDLHATVAGLQWSMDGYAIAYGSFLMLAGAATDRFGCRRVFQVGLALFTLGSLLCGAAPTIAALVACRMLQGLGGAMLNPAAMAIIAHTFVDPKARARAIGLWGTMTGASMAVGPILGGGLTQAFGWRAIFAINVPIGLVAIMLVAAFMAEYRGQQSRRFDAIGQALVVIVLAVLVGALIEGPHLGWQSPAVLGAFALVAAALVALIAHELRCASPLIELRFFRCVPFSAATAIGVLGFAAFNAFLFFGAFYLQGAVGLNPAQAGPRMLPAAIAIILCAPLAGRLVAAGWTRLPLTASGLSIVLGAALLFGLNPETGAALLLGAYALFGISLGMANMPVTHAAVCGMPRAQAGLAAGLASTGRSVGAALGVAFAGAAVRHGHDHMLALGVSLRPFWWLLIACGIVIAILGLLSKPQAAASP